MFVIRLPVNETHRRFRRRGRTPLRWLPFIFSDFKNIPPVFVTRLSVHHLHKRSRAARACPSGRHPFKIELSLQIVSAGIPPSDCLCILQIYAPFTERGVFCKKLLTTGCNCAIIHVCISVFGRMGSCPARWHPFT